MLDLTINLSKRAKLVGFALLLSVFGSQAQQTKKDQESIEYLYRLTKPNADLGDVLAGRAVLDAASFAEGPTSGTQVGSGPINGQEVPFINKQPIQGFSAVLNNGDGTFTAMSDNGFGSLENSADYNLRVYTIKPDFETKRGGTGTIKVKSFIELRDPMGLIPFSITNHFTPERVLTGADFDIESIQIAKDGTLWIGDEFGPFLLHFDKTGVLIDAPIALPDFDNPGKELRAPQNPFNEEASAIRIMNAMRTHARINGNNRTPVMSPWYVMLDDGDETTLVSSRAAPPVELSEASSEVFNVGSLNAAGHPVVVYTVNDLANMTRLIELGVQGIISDSPNLLYEAVSTYDGDGDGQPDFLDDDGLIDVNLFDAQGHRGGRDLRPENTLPGMEVALDFFMPTLELDCGITKDGQAVLDHDPRIGSFKARKADGTPYNEEDEVLIKELTLKEIQTTFIADKLLADRPAQTNDLSLSPVSVAFASENAWIDPYVMPSLQQVFDFVEYYVAYYKTGAGTSHPDAFKRWKNAERVRYNIETKINPRTDLDNTGVAFASRTVRPKRFARVVANTIVSNGLEERADIQSFDFRTLLVVHEEFPAIRTVCLFGDFPKVGDSGDGTNLQDQDGANTPWLAGLFWPYRSTSLTNPFSVQGSGGFEGMGITPNKKTLLPLLEKPLSNGEEGVLLIHEFDIASESYTSKKYNYELNERASAIGEFTMFSKNRGVIIERDGSQGDLNGFKVIYEVELGDEEVKKTETLDLLNINDVNEISSPGLPGDVGVGQDFAFPFVTIESVVVFNPFLLGVVNDNNYPFSVGRHVGEGLPDDNEFILVWLDRPLGRSFPEETEKVALEESVQFNYYPNPLVNDITMEFNMEDRKSVKVEIFTKAGYLVNTLVDEVVDAGELKITWDGTDVNGKRVRADVYIAVIQVGDQAIKKEILISK